MFHILNIYYFQEGCQCYDLMNDSTAKNIQIEKQKSFNFVHKISTKNRKKQKRFQDKRCQRSRSTLISPDFSCATNNYTKATANPLFRNLIESLTRLCFVKMFSLVRKWILRLFFFLWFSWFLPSFTSFQEKVISLKIQDIYFICKWI